VPASDVGDQIGIDVEKCGFGATIPCYTASRPTTADFEARLPGSGHEIRAGHRIEERPSDFEIAPSQRTGNNTFTYYFFLTSRSEHRPNAPATEKSHRSPN